MILINMSDIDKQGYSQATLKGKLTMGHLIKEQFAKLAIYNRRMNEQILAAISQLPNEALWQDKGAEFGSILGTLNHIMVIDLLLLRRFDDHPAYPNGFEALQPLLDFPQVKGIRQTLYPTLSDFTQARQALDKLISEFIQQIRDEDFGQALNCAPSVDVNSPNNQTISQPFYLLLQDLFNHQTHHRGQITTLLSQMGIKLQETDFLALVSDDKRS